MHDLARVVLELELHRDGLMTCLEVTGRQTRLVGGVVDRLQEQRVAVVLAHLVGRNGGSEVAGPVRCRGEVREAARALGRAARQGSCAGPSQAAGGIRGSAGRGRSSTQGADAAVGDATVRERGSVRRTGGRGWRVTAGCSRAGPLSGGDALGDHVGGHVQLGRGLLD